MNDLTTARCEPCDHWVPPMKPEEIERLKPKVGPEWQVEGNQRLVREFKLKNFKRALELVNLVGKIAEAEGHHPNMHLHDWNRVTMELYTHKINGLHQNDFILAAKIDQAFHKMRGQAGYGNG